MSDNTGRAIPEPHLSHTQVAMYTRCPRQYEYKYMLGINSPPGSALIKGKACDKAWNANYRAWLDEGVYLSPDRVGELAEWGFQDAVAEEGGRTAVRWDEDAPKAYDSAIRLARVHRERIAPAVEPAEVQPYFVCELPSGMAFVAFADLVDASGRIRDNKTRAKAMSGDDAKRDLQPLAYSFVRNMPTEFVFDTAIDSKPPKAESTTVHVSQQAIDWYTGLVDQVDRGVGAGVFAPNPNGWWCSPKWCGYYERCRGWAK